jgi:flagellar hook-associated protein 1 FlgK
MGARAMQAQQVGVEVTGQNVANSNNKTYSRQQVVLSSTDTINATGGTEGTGVTASAVKQIRDTFLDNQIVKETSVGGYWDAAKSNLSNIESQLGESLSSTSSSSSSTSVTSTVGIASQLNTLFTDFSSVATNPTSLSERQVLINDAQTLAGSLNSVSVKLDTINTNLNTAISTDVESANTLLTDIAKLNDSILKTEATTGGIANDLRDSRQAKIEELAQYLNLDASTAADGQITLSSSGSTLVQGNTVTASLQTFDSGSGQLMVQDSSGSPLTLTGGSIQAYIDVRDSNLSSLKTGVNNLATELINQINSTYSSGYDLNGNGGGSFFTGADASNIAVSLDLQTDPSRLQASGDPTATGDNTVALSLAQLADQPVSGLNNKTFSQSYNGLVTSLGNALSGAKDQVTNHTTVSSMLASQRDSVSGVSLQEELTNLITYQTAYSAASHIVSTVNTMFDDLLKL